MSARRKRTVAFQVRLSLEEKRRLDAVAERHGMPASHVVRLLVRAAFDKRVQIVPAAVG